MNRPDKTEAVLETLPGDRPKSCFVIAEVAQGHDGSLGLAHAYIDAVASTGADAVKFQTHIADAESTAAEPWRVKFSPQDATRYEYWKRMQFSEEQWAGLRNHADELQLEFLSSPFSLEAVELLRRVGVARWKIASGEVCDSPMFRRILECGLPVILSSDMSEIAELDDAVKRVKSKQLPLTVLQCTSVYPCPAEKVGLNMIHEFRKRYGCEVGLSDHSGKIYPGLAAAAIGIDCLEVHVTMSREMFGPDVASSLTTSELRQLVDGVRFIERMNAHPLDKNASAHELRPLRELFTKSVVARCDLPKGKVLTIDDLATKKPGTGISASRLESVVGRTLRHPVKSDQVLQESDLL